MKFSIFQISRKGSREINEDRMGYCYTRESAVFVLCDGMGGHPDGEVAAQLALETMASQFRNAAKPALAIETEFLSRSLLAAHQRIIRHASGNGMQDTPRTTLVAAVVQAGYATWIHCGDSRLYLVRDGKLLTRTRDHSYAERETLGVVRAENINRNVLFTCLGSPARPVFDVTGPMKLQHGDKILLCSDGLWGGVEDDQIARELGAKPVSVAVPDLVEQALRNGGPRCDNVTVIALEWETPDALESGHGISTDDIGAEGFASSIQPEDPVGVGVVDELNDDDIERSIAEINEAIRRTAARKS